MPLYLARGPSSFAYLIRARDRDHVNYIIDAMDDPGLFEVEVYDGPLNLMLTLPVTLAGDPDFSEAKPDLKVQYTGPTDYDQLTTLPTVDSLAEFEDEWNHLRRCAFPQFAAAIDDFDTANASTDSSAEVPREDLEAAIARDVIEQGRHALYTHLPTDDEDETQTQLGVSVPVESLLAGGRTHMRWFNSDWGDDPAEPNSAEQFQKQLDRAINRFGEVNLSFTANGRRWVIGRPAIAEGATLPEAIANAQKLDSMKH